MQLLISLLIIAATALVVYWIVKSNPAQRVALPAVPARAYEPVLPAVAPVHHWSDGGRFAVEVLTESRYDATLKALAGDHGDASARAAYVATLYPDEHNAYEDAAVAVFIAGRMCGYLAPRAALALRARLKRDGYEGQLTTCDAQVRGGGVWQTGRLAYVVALDLEPLER